MNGSLSLTEAHDISRKVEEAIWNRFGDEAQISLHMEPALRSGRS